ncbi:UDP-glucose/GDP-mannose dehydrogenase family protein [Polynucleobacter sp. MG-5-Ahmo-C2]|uniref:UDP-glucose dehydrogenase family protein n=1 Tax=Polynucleobacter sp. MG-5-Ahmo-C2 TaxID=2081051 RepID=UPI001BFDF967|nr:nucleotide sugar dehydrogenase [Polynucleobacter sp. MG-5-Ahmo-C2]QWD98828.1 UDP-glucose/GDP-mannose dehydrogenase family protein [Polynucleobacter sp. MG-5-Ahmo-C2]
MRVCVQGLWHLGSVTAACLASLGHEVVGLDSDQTVISSLNEGEAPLFEPDLNPLLAEGIQRGRLRFTSDMANACKDAELLWVTFDTPVDDDDVADINFVLNEVKSAVMLLSDGALVLVSSQLPVGSIATLENFSKEIVPNKRISFASCPENLRLGKALNVFLHPDRIIVGTRTTDDRVALEKLLSPITEKIEWMSIESAEMTKHAINAFLATSVTFANEIAAICELVGADAKEVERGLKSESRIGPKAYLSPGGPFAGGTLARDIEFLGKISQERQLSTPLLSSVRPSNDAHKKWVQRKLLECFRDLSDIRVAIWGLTYKAGTDTLRRSLSVELVDWLLEHGAQIQVYDPAVKELPINWANRVMKCMSANENLDDIQVLVVGTEWPEFKDEARRLTKFAKSNLLIIDANRHLLESLRGTTMSYLSVGSRQAN